jgi:hypothetical protein
LLVPLDRIEPLQRRGHKRRVVRVGLIAAVVAAAVALIGVSIAATQWGPLAGISSADRPQTQSDKLGPKEIAQLRSDELPAGASGDQIGKRLVDSARWVGSLPDGRNLYVIPSAGGKLCVFAAGLAESCGDALTRDAPITFTISANGVGSRPLVSGVALDDVVSVAFRAGGVSVTLPVRHNVFAYEGPPYEGPPSRAGPEVSAPTVSFSDGTKTTIR